MLRDLRVLHGEEEKEEQGRQGRERKRMRNRGMRRGEGGLKGKQKANWK